MKESFVSFSDLTVPEAVHRRRFTLEFRVQSQAIISQI